MKLIGLLTVIFLSVSTVKSQVEIWNYQGNSIGLDATGAAITNECFMPEIVKIGSTYFMYYTGRYSGKACISYATSPDMVTWTVQDTIMVSSGVTTDREYEVGGPSVIKTSTGQYRMYYRCCEAYAVGPPPYHIRSAISSDGINFTKEGIRIDIQPYDPTSYWLLAGQSAFYLDAGGNPRVIITGTDSTMVLGMPSRLYTASSSDGGLTWGGFTPLYSGQHDPVVIKDSSGTYHLYASYLLQGHRKAESPDGVGWPATADSILLQESAGPLTEESSPNMIADLGAGVDASGKVVLYSNYKPFTPGPWRDVAYYELDTTTGINDLIVSTNIDVYPNPVTDEIRFNLSSNGKIKILFFNSFGEIVFTGIINSNSSVLCSNWQPGIYFYSITNSKNNEYFKGKIIKQ